MKLTILTRMQDVKRSEFAFGEKRQEALCGGGGVGHNPGTRIQTSVR